jgi:prolyl oligopeptidase
MGSVFTFKTNQNALKYKLVSVDLSQSEPTWETLVDETADVLQSVGCFNQTYLILNYMHDCKVNHMITLFLSLLFIN